MCRVLNFLVIEYVIEFVCVRVQDKLTFVISKRGRVVSDSSDIEKAQQERFIQER